VNPRTMPPSACASSASTKGPSSNVGTDGAIEWVIANAIAVARPTRTRRGIEGELNGGQIEIHAVVRTSARQNPTSVDEARSNCTAVAGV
jgi:hypothetical protein